MARPSALLLTLLFAGLSTSSVAGQRGPAAAAGAVDPLVRSAVQVADSLFFAMEPLPAFRRLEARVELAPRDYEARWRAARAALVLGVLTNDDELKVAWLRNAVHHAEEALALRPDEVEAMAWAAATKGRLAIDAAGVRAQVRLGLDVWDLAHRVLAVDPNHPLANDVLGKLNQEVTKLSGFERFVARTFMGGGDPMRHSSWEKSETYLRRAIEADGTVVLFYLDLGDTYRLQGKLSEAADAYRAGLAVPDLYPTDAKFKEIMSRRLGDVTG